jgi:hypothetical protein
VLFYFVVFYCSIRYSHLKVKEQPEAEALAVKSSVHRQKTATEILKGAAFSGTELVGQGTDASHQEDGTGDEGRPSTTASACKHLMAKLLGDRSDSQYPIYREGTNEDFVKTIATGKICSSLYFRSRVHMTRDLIFRLYYVL